MSLAQGVAVPPRTKNASASNTVQSVQLLRFTAAGSTDLEAQYDGQRPSTCVTRWPSAAGIL